MKALPSLFRLRERSHRTARHHQIESLESRIALTATVAAATAPDDLVEPLHTDMGSDVVTVMATEVRTHHDIIPRFAANPTNFAIRGGNWNDPTIWSAGHVPQASDRILIGAGRVVTYSTQSDVRLDSLEISGSLIFSSTTNTRMLIANVMVMPDGLLQIGSKTDPVRAGVTAELVIADKPLDLTKDPRQFGTGLIGFGSVQIHGQSINTTWHQLIEEPKAGVTMLFLSGAATGWKSGDTIVLPDSRQVPASQFESFLSDNYSSHAEEVTIRRVVGNIVVLQTPLKYDHPGARNVDGDLEIFPHVALLNRNVVVRSENPNGTRGHTLFTGRADVDIEYARFQDLGRTDAFRDLDNTTVDANGNVTHIGTNQIARYAVHYHHLLGPVNPTNSGYQFEFIGNSVENSRKWAVDVHGTSYGLLERNVVYGAQGAGFATEAGNEIGNVFRDNIAMGVHGTHSDGDEGTAAGDYGRGGSGFWFRRGGNYVIGNVASDNTFAGFVIDGYNLTPPRLPLFRGANINMESESTPGDLTSNTLLINNQAYGRTQYGIWAAYTAGVNLLPNQPTTLIYNTKLWNIASAGIRAYHTAKLTIDSVVILEDLAARDRNDTGPTGMAFHYYENNNLVIRRTRIEGAYFGIIAPADDASRPGMESPTVIKDSTLKNYINITVGPARTYANVLEVRNVRFQLVKDLPQGPVPTDRIRPAANIEMRITGAQIDYTRPSIVRVYDYNQVAGDNFQVFYREQADNYVMPQTNPYLMWSRDWGDVGSPEYGLTNAQNWAKYGLAFAGSLLPSNAAASRPEINGLVAPIQAQPAVPRVVPITPWNNVAVLSGFLAIRYNVIGQLAPGTAAYVKLDDQIYELPLLDGGLFNVQPGQRKLEFYVGDSQGVRLRNSPISTVQIFVVG